MSAGQKQASLWRKAKGGGGSRVATGHGLAQQGEEKPEGTRRGQRRAGSRREAVSRVESNLAEQHAE